MIAKVKCAQGVYTSVVFGIICKGWKTRAIVLSEDYNSIKLVKFWKPTRNVFVVNANRKDWIVQKNFEGYDWVYENLKKKLFNFKINDCNILEKCKELQSKVVEPEWHKIESNEDLENLDAAALNFHDAVVNDMHEGKDFLAIEFGAWDCDITIELEGEPETNLYVGCGNSITEDNYWDGITDSSMFFENGFIYWVSETEITKSESINNATVRYFKAKNLKWKIEI